MNCLSASRLQTPRRLKEATPMSEATRTIPMRALLLCKDVQFLGVTRNVLSQLEAAAEIVDEAGHALRIATTAKHDVVIVDWRQIDDPAEFFLALRRAPASHDSVLVAITRDLLDARQAFTAGVHFLIHKPASAVQIERCLRTAFLASIARRRKVFRAPVTLAATLNVREWANLPATIVNLGEGGAGLRLASAEENPSIRPMAGDFVSLAFALPSMDASFEIMGRVVWSTAAGDLGIQFAWIADAEREKLEAWLTQQLVLSVAALRAELAVVCA
jgi:CheY-like chemotaxis protein